MAIAVGDSANLGTVNPGTNLTAAFTNTSGNILFIGVVGRVDTTSAITAVSYGGVACTQIGTGTYVPSGRYIQLFYLLNPATGSNDVSIDASSSYIEGFAVSYTGGNGGIDANDVHSGSSITSLAKAVTTVADNDWVIALGADSVGTIAAGASTTLRQVGNGYSAMFDSNAPVTPAGSRTLTITDSSGNMAMVVAAFKPGSASSGFLALL